MLLSGAVYEPLTLRPTLNGRFPAILKYGEDVITSQKHMRILKKASSDQNWLFQRS